MLKQDLKSEEIKFKNEISQLKQENKININLKKHELSDFNKLIEEELKVHNSIHSKNKKEISELKTIVEKLKKVIATPLLKSEYMKEMGKQIKDIERGVCSIDQNSIYYLSPHPTSQTQRDLSKVNENIQFNHKVFSNCSEVSKKELKSIEGRIRVN